MVIAVGINAVAWRATGTIAPEIYAGLIEPDDLSVTVDIGGLVGGATPRRLHACYELRYLLHG